MIRRITDSLFGCLAALAIASMPIASKAIAADENVLGLPVKAVSGGGSLVICGGGRLPDEVYDEFIRLAGGKNARLVIVPSAYPFSSMAAVRSRYSGWRTYGTASLDYLDAKTRAEADSEAFLAPLRKATAIWLAGGSQVRLARLYGGTKAEAAMIDVLTRGGAIGGTSAGAAVMSQQMLWQVRGTREIVVERGFGLLTTAIVDQHFTQRNRHTRLLNVLADHPGTIGLGVDEGTALVVKGNELRVIGRANVTFCLSKAAEPTYVQRLTPKTHAELIATSAKAGNTSIQLRPVE
jgi:cyanophycinase